MPTEKSWRDWVDWKIVREGCPYCGTKIQWHTLTGWCLCCGWAKNWRPEDQ